MALLGQLISNGMSDNPQDFGNVVSNYATNRYNQDLSNITNTPVGGATPNQSTITPSDATLAQTPTQPQMGGMAALGAPSGSLGLQIPQSVQSPSFNFGAPTQPSAQPAAPQPMGPTGTGVQMPQPGQMPMQAPGQAQVQAPQVNPMAQAAPSAQAPVNPIGQVPAGMAYTPPAVGAPTQVAGPMVAGAVAQPQTQPTAPAWQTELQTAQGNPDKLWAYTQNQDYPEESRKIAASMYSKEMEHKKQADETMKTYINAVQNNDLRAQQNVMKKLAQENEDGSLLKAVFYRRLGLNDLAQQEQQKLGAGNKWGQTSLDGQAYATERDANGMIRRALDTNGATVDDATLAKLQSAGAPFGSHAFGFTGETGVVTDPNGAKAEVAKRTNAITGKADYVYLTGPYKDQVYQGAQMPQPKSISTAIAKKEGTEAVTLNYAGALAATRAGAGSIGKFNAENGTNLAIPSYGPHRGKLVDMNNGGMPVQPDQSGNFNPVINQRVQPAPAATTQSTAPAAGNLVQTAAPAGANLVRAANAPSGPQQAPVAAVAQPKFRESGYETETPQQFKDRTKNFNEANKEIAKRNAEVVANAGNAANTIDQAQHAIDLLDSGKHNIGPELSIISGRGPVAQAIGTQLETEDARNTRSIMDTVRAIGGAASQGTIKGHLTNQELQFLTENKPTEKSDPQYTKQWLQKSIEMIRRAQSAAESQARTGGAASNPVTGGNTGIRIISRERIQ
jgi:hypothetical protein